MVSISFFILWFLTWSSAEQTHRKWIMSSSSFRHRGHVLSEDWLKAALVACNMYTPVSILAFIEDLLTSTMEFFVLCHVWCALPGAKELVRNVRLDFSAASFSILVVHSLQMARSTLDFQISLATWTSIISSIWGRSYLYRVFCACITQLLDFLSLIPFAYE